MTKINVKFGIDLLRQQNFKFFPIQDYLIRPSKFNFKLLKILYCVY